MGVRVIEGIQSHVESLTLLHRDVVHVVAHIGQVYNAVLLRTRFYIEGSDLYGLPKNCLERQRASSN